MDSLATTPVMPQPGRGDPAAFACRVDRGFLDLLATSGQSLAVSTYQAGKVILLGANEQGRVTLLPRQFDKPMGLAVDGHRLAVACRTEIVVLADAPILAPHHPGRQSIYDGLYLPRARYCTGEVDIHDLAWGRDGLLGVATRMDCLAWIGDGWSLEPVWQPPFVTDLAPDDRCHLNGMALRDGAPTFVTAAGRTDRPLGWREGRIGGGILMRVADGALIADGLCMPHSPRHVGEQLWVLNAGAGEVLCIDPAKPGATPTLVTRLPGFLRGMVVTGDVAFIGLSQLRPNRAFTGLPLEGQDLICGIVALDIGSGRELGRLHWLDSVVEIYDIAVLPRRRPGIAGPDSDIAKSALALPDRGWWSVATKS